jgi:hypothetical protein
MTFYKAGNGEVYDFDYAPTGAHWTKLSTAKGKLARAEYCKAELRKLIPQGSTVYTLLREVSRSGMSRQLSVFVMTDNAPRDITYLVIDACGFRRSKRDYVEIGGCGFNAGFQIVYDLGSALYRDTHVCTGKGCPSNDHVNGDRNYAPHAHADGGYSLRHATI